MKAIFSLVLVCSLTAGMAQSNQASIAIVELFTSQGCSSCPAADKLLKEAVESRSPLGSVYGLSFHVSYWNRLGWKDPYSSDQFTDRQKWYAYKMRLSRIYTPQMVVDGREEFVGSQKHLLTEKLKSSFANNKKKEIVISKVKKSEGLLNLSYQCDLDNKEQIINIALIQKLASNRVPRGENRHKILTHANVVRAFKTQTFSQIGKVEMIIPELDSSNQYELVLYTQDTTTLQIMAVGVISI